MRTLIVSIICSFAVLAYLIYFVVNFIDDKKITKWELFWFLITILCLCLIIGMNTGDLLNIIFLKQHNKQTLA